MISQKETKFGIDNGCLPVQTKAPYYLPLSLDLVSRGFEANSEQRLLSLFSEFYDTLGPNIEQSLLGATGFVTIDPVSLEAILSSRFDGPRRINSFWAFLGDGIFSQDGQSWKRSREPLRRQFVRMQYQSVEVFKEHVDNLVDARKRAPDIVDLQPIFFRYNLDITTALTFNQSVSPLQNEGRDFFSEDFGYGANVTAMRARLGDFYWLHTSRRFVKACKEVKMYADAFIAQALSDAKQSLLSGCHINQSFLTPFWARTLVPKPAESRWAVDTAHAAPESLNRAVLVKSRS
ncbi:hypothetical protein PV04_02566 [Phialophora macrospora]|uniref:Uncharacterized protein n=1 Tax=Phialophora macrospora TaxID=1851006 RepID=A0A0D2CYI7_9EURO|nr:hypothetical protein PV04_02566 [Phialophora macrospora]